MSLREPERWQAVKKKVEGNAELELDLAPRAAEWGALPSSWATPSGGPRALLGLALASVGLATYWGIFALGPDLVRAGARARAFPKAQSDRPSSWAYLLMNFTGGLLGLLAFAPVAAWKGRRFAFVFYHLGALILTPITFLGAQTYAQTLWLLPAMAFFVVGMHAGYAIYFPELFPTRLRATGSSFCFNLGRVVAAAILLVRGSAARRASSDLAACRRRHGQPVPRRPRPALLRPRDARPEPARMKCSPQA